MKRSKHNLSYYNNQSMNMGDIVPIGLTEVLPGDTFQHSTSAMLRCSPLLAPVMHPVHVKIHHWFVPHRLVWDDFENFITGGPDGDSVPVFPTIDFTSVLASTLPNYLGLPVTGSIGPVSALPFRGYALIFNEWYRDQDLVDPLPISKASGADVTTNTALVAAAWEKDRFTSARPWTQKGPDITVPIGGVAAIQQKGGVATSSVSAANTAFRTASSGGGSVLSLATTGAAGASTPNVNSNAGGAGGIFAFTSGQTVSVPDLASKLEADLSTATSLDVNDFRLAMALQRYEENRARYGSRYTEYLRFLGVRSSDARLQRPEYLGGGKQTIQFSEVLQTAEGTSPVGEMRGHGIAAVQSNSYRRFFEEHGYVFSFMIIRPKAVYANGINRHWLRRTKEMFWQKELEHIGQDAIENQEVYAAAADPDGVFGYQDKYDDYRYAESRVAGEFATSELDYWNMARKFDSEPVLNDDFVNCIPTTRIFASTDTDQIYAMIQHKMVARRLVSAVGKSFIY